MRTIKSFMCFKLETGSYIVAVFCMICAFLSFLYYLDALRFVLHENKITAIETKNYRYGDQKVFLDSVISEWIYQFGLLAQAVTLAVYIIFILGTMTQEVKLMIPGVVICAFGTVMNPLAILLMDISVYGLFKAYLLGVAFYFCFVTLYSTYVKIRDEKSTNCPAYQEFDTAATNP